MMHSRSPLILVTCLIAVAACTTDTADRSTTTTTPPVSTTLSPTSTSTTASSDPTTTAATTTIPPTTTTIPPTTQTPPTDLATGLLCRDLMAMSYGYADAITYWIAEGRPERMDVDRNGIPCETVYPAGDVAAYWGDPLPTSTTIPPRYEPTTPWQYPDPIPPGSPMYGSGCSPGTTGLPDGEWFGFLTQIETAGVEFDLACLIVPGDDEEGGAPIRNDNPKTRPFDIGPDTPVHYVTGGWVNGVARFAEWADSIGCYAADCPVWMYVNAGRVTAIAEHFLTG